MGTGREKWKWDLFKYTLINLFFPWNIIFCIFFILESGKVWSLHELNIILLLKMSLHNYDYLNNRVTSFTHFLKIYLFIYLWLCWVFVSVWGLSLVVASGGHSSSRCVGLSLSWPLLLWSTGSRRTGSAIVAQGLSRSAACGIFPDQGSNPCPLHWQADSQPLCHQGSPVLHIFDFL